MEEEQKKKLMEELSEAVDNDYVNIEIQKMNQKVVLKVQIIKHI
jgi:hypothetical protein